MSKDPHDRKNYMGIWTAIHILGKTGLKGQQRQINANAIFQIATNLGCTHGCVDHARMFFQQNPIDQTFNDDSEYALFDWTVKFHNHANRITRKPEMDLEEARKLYYKPVATCSKPMEAILIRPEY